MVEVLTDAVGAALPDLIANGVEAVLPRPLPRLVMPSGFHPVWGHMAGGLANKDRLWDWQLEQTIDLQRDPEYLGCWQTTVPLQLPDVVITDPQLLQYLLDQAENHPAIGQQSDKTFEILSAAFGETSIFMIDGPEWQHRRKYYSHLFSMRSLREVMLPQFEKNTEKIIAFIDRQIQKTASFDIQNIFQRATLDAITQVAFDEDMGCLDSDDTPEFMTHFDRTQDISMMRSLDPFWKWMRFFKIGYEKHFTESMDFVNTRILDLLETRRIRGRNSGQFTILDLFEDRAKKDGRTLTQQALRDITWDFMVAGRDTTACASTWLMYYFATRPDVVARIRSEFEDQDVASIDVLLHKLPYLTAVCFEQQRLKPSVPNDTKGVKTDLTLPNGLKIPKGVSLVYSPYTFGHNPKFWGDDVEEFKPERWLDSEGEVRSFTEGKFPQFNGGPRLCLGKTMALLEMKNIAVRLLQNFDFALVEDQKEKVHYKTSIMLWVKGGLWLNAKRRGSRREAA